MKKAFFINGGAGRVLCAIPALEYYKENTDPDVVNDSSDKSSYTGAITTGKAYIAAN